MDDEILIQVTSLIEKQMGKYRKPITRETCLENDLGISGDDAVELLLAYSKKFSVDISKLDIRKYFMPEGDTILSSLIGSKERKEKQLTIGDLAKGIIAKQLNEEIINSEAT
jgi:acyl carrier protein